MAKQLVNLRLEKTVIDGIKEIAKQQKVKPSKLMRNKVNEIIQNDYSTETKMKAKQLVKELRSKFAYVKTKKDIARAKRERESREEQAKRIEAAFNLT